MLLLGSAHQDNWAQRWGFGILGIVASLVLITVSMAMNYDFGRSLGRTPASGQIYAWASVAADMFKVLSPFFIAAAWRARSWNWAAACALVWLITAGYGTLSAAGHAALNRADTSGARTIKANTYNDSTSALERAQKDLGWVPPHRPSGVVLSEMTGMKAKPQWTWSSECARPDGKDQAKFCQTYYKLKGELESAESAQKLETRIAELMATRAGADAAAIGGADPQANILAKLTNLDLSTINFALILMVILLLETGSGLGMFVSVKYLTGGQKGGPEFVDKTPPTPLEEQAEVSIVSAALPSAQRMLPAPLTRPEPPPEGKAVLARIGFPKVKPEGDPRPLTDAERETVGLRMLAWLTCHGIRGEFAQDVLWQLFKEFWAAQGHLPMAERHAKPALEAVNKGRKYYATKTATSPVIWSIRLPDFEELNYLLDRAGFPAAPKTSRSKAEKPVPTNEAKPEPEEVAPQGGDNVLRPGPFGGAAPAAASTDVTPSAPKPSDGATKVTRGSQRRFYVDIDAMQSLAREHKRVWQARMFSPDRKQRNRMARNRVA